MPEENYLGRFDLKKLKKVFPNSRITRHDAWKYINKLGFRPFAITDNASQRVVLVTEEIPESGNISYFRGSTHPDHLFILGCGIPNRFNSGPLNPKKNAGLLYISKKPISRFSKKKLLQLGYKGSISDSSIDNLSFKFSSILS